MAQTTSHFLLVAEAEAWPFASAKAFEQRTINLMRTAAGVLAPQTQKLAVSLEDWLRVRSAGLSLEVLRQLRDGVWFRNGESDIPLARVLTRLARQHLSNLGNRVGLRQADDMPLAEAAARIRWLSFRLPMDLVIAALFADSKAEPTTDRVSLMTPHLARVLDKPAAETHLHVGAAVSFEVLWTGLMRGLAGNTPDERKLERGGPPPFSSARRFLRMLLVAAITRNVLSRYLRRVERLGPEPFATFLDEALTEELQSLGWSWGTRDMLRLHGQILDELQGRPENGITLAQIRGLYRHLVGPARNG